MSTGKEQLTKELLTAVKKGDLDVVVDCLAKGVNPNSINDYGTSAVAFSVIHDVKGILEILLKHGANPNIKNKDGLSALDIAERDNHVECLRIIGKYLKKNALKNKKGLFPYSKGKDTKTAHINYREYPRTQEFEYKFHRDTIEIVNEQVQVKKHKLRIGDVGGGDAHSTQHLAAHFAKQIPILERQADKPYYARLDIKRLENGNVESYYIGSRGIYSEADRVYAAQSPYGGLFAQKKLGKITDSELGEIEVSLIRNIENEKGKIYQITDKEWTDEQGYVDPVLMKKLNDHAKSKMNEIWETIQAEQDSVVRQGISVPVIVQGSAGSGKTVIALHRLSYLLYHYNGQLEEKKIMVLGPSAMYLSYIQEALPFLDVGEIRQETFQKFCTKRIPFKELGFAISDYYDIVRNNFTKSALLASNSKGSLQYRSALKDFLLGLKIKLIPDSGVYLYTPVGEFSFPKERIQHLFNEYTSNGNFESAKFRIVEMLKTEHARFKGKLSRIQSSKLIEYEKELDAKVFEFIKSWKIPNIFEIYKTFSTSKELLSNFLKVEIDQLETFILENKENYKKKLVTHDDLAALIEIQEWLTGKIGLEDGAITNQKFDYIIIDEVQDYSAYQLSIIKSLAKDGRIMLLGDLGQSIHEYRGIEEWGTVKTVFATDKTGDIAYIELSTIYRSTVQIVQFANELIRSYTDNRYQLSEPIGREGAKPIVQKYTSLDNQVKEISEHIENLHKKNYVNLALVTRSWQEAKKLYKDLRKIYKDIQLIEDSTEEYKGGLIVIPVYLTKGIEYDAVILTDASLNQYTDDDHHRKLLYVAVTRALHQVIVLYDEILTLPMLDGIDKKKADDLRLESKKKVKEPVKNEVTDIKEHFLESVQKGVEALLSPYTVSIEKLKKENQSLRMELEEIRNTPMNTTSYDDVEKEVLLQFILSSNEEIIFNFLDSLKGLAVEEKEILIISVIQGLVQLGRPRPLIQVFEYFEKELIDSDSISDIAAIRYLTVLDVLLDKMNTPKREDSLILIKALALVKTSSEHIQGEFITNSSQKLNKAVTSLNNVQIILSVIKWYFEYEQKDQMNYLIEFLFKNWNVLEPQFTKTSIVRLLWYAFESKKDIKLFKRMNRELIDPKIVEIKLYIICYKVIKGDTTEANIIRKLLKESTLFGRKEKELIEKNINNRVVIGVVN